MQTYLPFNSNEFTEITADSYLEHLKWRNVGGRFSGSDSYDLKYFCS